MLRKLSIIAVIAALFLTARYMVYGNIAFNAFHIIFTFPFLMGSIYFLLRDKSRERDR